MCLAYFTIDYEQSLFLLVRAKSWAHFVLGIYGYTRRTKRRKDCSVSTVSHSGIVLIYGQNIKVFKFSQAQLYIFLLI